MIVLTLSDIIGLVVLACIIVYILWQLVISSIWNAGMKFLSRRNKEESEE